MKILHFTQDMSAGGVEAIVCNLLNEMVKGYDVTLGTVYAVNKSQIHEQKLDSRVKRVSAEKKTQGLSLRVLWRVFLLIRSGRYDVVHIHGWFYYFVLPILVLQKRTKFFYTVHSDAKMENTSVDMCIIKLKHWCFARGMVRAVTISKPSQKSFSDFYGVESKLIYNGVKRYYGESGGKDYGYRVSPNTKVFVHPARISSEKNQLMLVRIFNRLINEGEDVVLLIAGQIRDKGIFEQIETFFSDRIRYIGVRSDIPQLMEYSYGFCLCSDYEGLPVTLLEALSAGCIPVCTPVGGIVEVIHHRQNGFLSIDCNEESYYAVMKTVIRLNEEDCSRVKAACVECFGKFDIVNTARDYIDYYKEVCAIL